MEEVAARLTNVQLECRPALEMIEKYGANDSTVLYVDPPYLGSTRNGTNYTREMTNEDEHVDLAAALRGCRAAVALSGYDSEQYRELFGDWRRVDLAARNAASGTATEVVWLNR